MKMTLKRAVILSALTFFLSVLVVPANANGAPVKIFLNYLPKTSNYGPENASGTATVSIGEAWIDLTADGMPKLDKASYQIWITNAETKDMISLGTFNADAEGHVAYSAELDDIPIADYRYMLVSVEPDPDPNPDEPDSRITIAGVFPNAQILIVNGGAPTATPAPGMTPQAGAPETLPVTGKYNTGIWTFLAILVGLGMISVVVLFKHNVFNQEIRIAETQHTRKTRGTRGE